MSKTPPADPPKVPPRTPPPKDNRPPNKPPNKSCADDLFDLADAVFGPMTPARQSPQVCTPGGPVQIFTLPSAPDVPDFDACAPDCPTGCCS